MDWGQDPTICKHTVRSSSTRHQFMEILNSDYIVLYTVPSPPFSLGVPFSFSLEPEPVIYKVRELAMPTCSLRVVKGPARVHAFPGHSSVDWHCTAQQSGRQRKAKAVPVPQALAPNGNGLCYYKQLFFWSSCPCLRSKAHMEGLPASSPHRWHLMPCPRASPSSTVRKHLLHKRSGAKSWATPSLPQTAPALPGFTWKWVQVHDSHPLPGLMKTAFLLLPQPPPPNTIKKRLSNRFHLSKT